MLDQWGGTTQWTDSSYAMGTGIHTITFRYSKDSIFSDGDDRVYVDLIRSDGVPSTPMCGDGFKSASEPCEGTDLGTSTCDSEGFLGGTLACTATCTLDTSGCTVPTWTEDWETADFSSHPWGNDGVGMWVVDGSSASEGLMGAHSPTLQDGEHSDLTLEMEFAQDGTLAFSVRTDADFGDNLEFYMDDGVPAGDGDGDGDGDGAVQVWTGNTPWTDVYIPVTAGKHRMTWRYAKNDSFAFGADRVWIDNLRADGMDCTTCDTCGDGFLGSTEACDGTLFSMVTCESQGFLGGNLGCDGACAIDTSMCVNATWTETWESGDALANPWLFDGDGGPWVVDTTNVNEGTYSIHPADLTNNQSTRLQLEMEFTLDGAIAFELATDSQINSDYARFYVDGNEVAGPWSGDSGWINETVPVPTGKHLMEWEFDKDVFGKLGDDTFYLDNIRSNGAPCGANCDVCGDAYKSLNEECDDPQFGGETCETLGFFSGTLGCDGTTCTFDTSGCTMAAWNETWETGDFTNATWVLTGDGNWTVDNTDAFQGSFSAVSPSLSDDESAELSLEMDYAADGAIAFAVLSDADFGDGLQFEIDGTMVNNWNATVPWTDVQFPVTAGKHLMTWKFVKDSFGSSGMNRVRLDNIRADGVECTTCATCGDMYLGLQEVCDDTMFGANTCGSEGFLGGVLGCTNQCALDTSACTMATWNEDWETGDFSANPWMAGGTTGWVVDGSDVNNGSFSAHSGAIADGQTSDVSVSMTFGAGGTIAFAHRTDTESCCDHLQFLVDGVQQGSNISGSTAWGETSFPVPMGTHTLTWRYTKDGSVSTGADRVWIDDVRSDGTVP
jgi:hypothetical protein